MHSLTDGSAIRRATLLPFFLFKDGLQKTKTVDDASLSRPHHH